MNQTTRRRMGLGALIGLTLMLTLLAIPAMAADSKTSKQTAAKTRTSRRQQHEARRKADAKKQVDAKRKADAKKRIDAKRKAAVKRKADAKRKSMADAKKHVKKHVKKRTPRKPAPKVQAVPIERLSSNPQAAKVAAIKKIQALSARMKDKHRAVDILVGIAKMERDPVLQRIAIFTAAEILEKAGLPEEAAEMTSHIFRIANQPPTAKKGVCPKSGKPCPCPATR